MSEWQDISTAPKDGSIIILYVRGHREDRYGEAYWLKDVGFCWANTTRVAETFGGLPAKSTHWMPFPPPPSQVGLE